MSFKIRQIKGAGKEAWEWKTIQLVGLYQASEADAL